jgi:hypothetical protein
MQARTLGTKGLEASAIGLGSMGLSFGGSHRLPQRQGPDDRARPLPGPQHGHRDRRQPLQAGRLRREPQVRGGHRDAPVRRGEGADFRPVRRPAGRAGFRDARLRRLLPGGERRRAEADEGTGPACRRRQLRRRFSRPAPTGRLRADRLTRHVCRRQLRAAQRGNRASGEGGRHRQPVRRRRGTPRRHGCEPTRRGWSASRRPPRRALAKPGASR